MNIIKKYWEKVHLFFKKESLIGLYIEPSGSYQYIEVKKVKGSYTPVFWYNDIFENFTDIKNFKKKDVIEKVKQFIIKKKVKTIFLNSFEDKKQEKEIISALKIIGFDKVIIKEKNIAGIILNSFFPTEKMTVFFQKEKVVFYVHNKDKIITKEEIFIENFSVFKINELCKKIKNIEQISTISLVNVPEIVLNSVKDIFSLSGFQTEKKNIWENFLDFSDVIPEILSKDSHDFINVLSITIPGLKTWEKEKIIEKKKKKLFLPKKKNKIYLPKPKKSKNKSLKEIIIEKNKKKILLPKKRRFIYLSLKSLKLKYQN